MKEFIKGQPCESPCNHVNHKQKCYGENIYSKVGNEKRLALLDLVKLQGKSLKDAANVLGINYSTAKTILRVYRIENRILKKSPNQKRSTGKRRCYRGESNLSNGSGVPGSRSSPSSLTQDNSSIIEQEYQLDHLGQFSQTSPGRVPPQVTKKVQPQNLSCFSQQDLILQQFKQIVTGLQFCMAEVVNNDKIIKNICETLNLNYPSFIQYQGVQGFQGFNGETSDPVSKPIPVYHPSIVRRIETNYK